MKRTHTSKQPQERNSAGIVGLFISDPKFEEAATHWDALGRAAPANQVTLRHVKGTPGLIAALIPEALRRKARSWLVIHRQDRSQELLVVPYPDSTILMHLLEAGGLDRHAFETLEVIRGARDRNWYADIGYSNLSRLKAGTTGWKATPGLYLNCFQVVSLDDPLEKLLEEKDWGREETRQVLREASVQTRELRADLLARVVEESDPLRRVELVRDLEEFLTTRNLEISEKAARYVETTATTTLLSTFGDLLDKDSKRFLYSSEVVKLFATDCHPEDFDYSLPASGLWKVVEREINLSIVWFLRIRKGVAGTDSPWDALLPAKNWVEMEKALGGKVNLNRHAGSGKLLGLTLGEVRCLMMAAYDNGILSEVEALGRGSRGSFSTFQGEMMNYLLGPAGRGMTWEGSLPWLLKKVGEIRNRHAHVEAMRQPVFQELEKLILSPGSDPWSSHLGKILSVKRCVHEYVRYKRLEQQ